MINVKHSELSSIDLGSMSLLHNSFPLKWIEFKWLGLDPLNWPIHVH